MPFNPASPLPGAAQTGFTSPTYTLVEDFAPTRYGTQKAVSAVGGTQAGVTANTVGSPFTINFVRPSQFKGLPSGYVSGQSIPRNQWKLITRKGVIPAAGGSSEPMVIETIIKVPAGAESNDPSNVKAALAAHFGALWEQSDQIGDLALTGL